MEYFSHFSDSDYRMYQRYLEKLTSIAGGLDYDARLFSFAGTPGEATMLSQAAALAQQAVNAVQRIVTLYEMQYDI